MKSKIHFRLKKIVSMITVLALSTIMFNPVVNAATTTYLPICLEANTFDSSNVAGDGQTTLLWSKGVAEPVGGILRLVPATTSETGSVVRRNKVTLSGGFSTFFVMNMHDGSNPPADGLMFVLQSNPTPILGNFGAGLGFDSVPNSVGVEFDIWQNTGLDGDTKKVYYDPQNPNSGEPNSANYVAIVRDGDNTHNSANGDVIDNNLNFNLYGGTDINVWIDYDGTNLTAYYGTSPIRDDNRHITENIGNYLQNKDIYVGFSASTGGSTSDQDIERWYFSDNYVPGGLNSTPGTYEQGANSTNIQINGSPSNPSSATITVQDISNKNMANQAAEIYIDNNDDGSINTGSDGTSGTYNFNCSSLMPGTHTIKAVAESGGASSSTTFNVSSTDYEDSAAEYTSTPVVGTSDIITLTAKNLDGTTDSNFNGNKNVTISGVLQAPDGSYGSFNGTTLSAATQTVSVSFTNGVATPNLVLDEAATHTIGFSIAGITTPATNSLSITPVAGLVASLEETTAPVAGARVDTTPVLLTTNPVVTLKDAYGNVCSNGPSAATSVTASVSQSGSTGWVLGGTVVKAAVNGIVTYTDLTAATSTDTDVSGAKINYAAGTVNTDGAVMNLLMAPAAPTASGVTISGTAQVGQTLTGNYTYADANGDAENGSTFKWYRSDDASGTNKTAISGATEKTYTLTSADLGKYISFEVTPITTVAPTTGTPEESTAVPVLGVPNAPANVTATAGNASASITWTTPANDGGSPITDYLVNIYSNGNSIKTINTDSTTPSATVVDLTNGTPYMFTVNAENSVGYSTTSSATSVVVPTAPAGVPDAPTDVEATAGNASASITWTTPANDGGSPITDYLVNIYSNGNSIKTINTDSTTPSATVVDLTNGTPYTFTVNAENSVGYSTTSSATSVVVPTAPAGAPDAPQNVAVTAGDSYASLTWTAPANDGGSPITDYLIDVYSNGSLVKTIDTGSTATSATVTGLVNGTSYTFDVKALNNVGAGAPTSATNVVTPTAPHESRDSYGSGTGATSTPTSAGPTITANVVDGGSGSNSETSVNATVTANSNGTDTVSVKPSDAILIKQPDGTTAPFEDYSKIGYNAPSNAPVTINSDGTVEVSNLAKGSSYDIPVTYDMGNGQKITIGNMHISVDASGNVKMTSSLIDPYGTLTDSLSGKVISGANVTLYYADTARNRAAGKIPGTIVQLPIINGFKPNNNQDPQTTDSNGAYGFMVYPNTDYYIVVTKDGYDTYTSPTIPVETELVKFSAKLNPPVTGVKRIAGNTRVDTAIELAKSEFTGKVNSIIFATADNYPDALTGSVLAYNQSAPILLVGDSQDDQNKVLTYMKDYLVNDGKVFLLGGTGVVTDNFANEVKAAGYSNIIRLGGKDRYETSSKIADYLNVSEGTPVVIASGENYPDALSVSSAAAVNQYPVLLVTNNTISDLVKSELTKIKPSKIYVIGEQGAISDSVENQLAQLTSLNSDSVVRLGGTDRYATSVIVANNFKLPGKSACISTGTNFPDALAGSIYAANYNAPIILVGNTLTDEEKTYIQNSKLSGTTIFGGEGAVNDEIQDEVTGLLSK